VLTPFVTHRFNIVAMPRILGFVRHLAEDELSYNVSRPYHLGRWFKPLVCIGSLCVFAVLTVFTLAANGFDKQFRYTTNPNITEAQTQWFNNKIFTWGDDKLDPKCQKNEIPVGHEFMTTNLGLHYTVQKILYSPNGLTRWQEKSSVSYLNNPLTQCEVESVNIFLKRAESAKRDKEYRWWSWIDSSANAMSHCDIINEDGVFRLVILANYETADDSYGYIAINNATSHASFWWGARLLNTYFVGTKYFMSLPDTEAAYTRATLSYTSNSRETTSMKDTKLFNNQFYFLDEAGNIGDHRNTIPENGELYNNPSFAVSRPLTEGFFFAKLFRSLLLVDLGNTTAPNLLLDEDLLQYALDPGEDDFNRLPGGPLTGDDKVDWFKFNAIPPPNMPLESDTAVPLNEAYAKFTGQTGTLETKNASIYAEYICAVAEKKPTSAMFLFTLVANLALFQTAWTIFKYVLDRRVTWKDPTANWCEGCLANGHEMAPVVHEENSMKSPQKAKRPDSIGSSSTGRLLGEENEYV
jgi:hypothetical protein